MIFAISTYIPSFYLGLVGRFIFGVGNENIGVAESTMLSKWFIGHEISLAMSVDTCVSRLGNAIALITQPWLNTKTGGISTGVILSVVIVGISIAMSWVLTITDKKYENKDIANNFEVKTPEADKMSIRDILLFKADFWVMAFMCGLYYVCISTFIVFLKVYLQRKFNETKSFYSMPYLMGAVLTPALGITIDKLGKRSVMLIISGVLYNLAHFIILILPEASSRTYIISLVLLGSAYSLMVGSLWSAIPYTIN